MVIEKNGRRELGMNDIRRVTRGSGSGKVTFYGGKKTTVQRDYGNNLSPHASRQKLGNELTT